TVAPEEIRDELRVKEVVFGPVEALELRVKPNLPVLGPRLGRELGAVRMALIGGDFEALEGGGFRGGGYEVGAEEGVVERVAEEGWAVAEDAGLTVALDTTLDAELELEARLLDFIHQVNGMRRDAGLAIQTRIALVAPSELAGFEERIAEETLATEIRF